MEEVKMKYKEIITQWIEAEKCTTCGIEARKRYANNHKYRFNYLYNLCLELNSRKQTSILDVGRSQLSVMLAKYYESVSTLGFNIEEDEGGHREIEKIKINHIIFNLNECQEVDKWPNEKFDLIIYSEVIEHLFEAPEYTFLFFKFLLKPEGYLICTTPNSAYLAKRICSFIGKNPLPGIRFYNKNPGHYREYTKNDLINMTNKCDLKIINHRYIDFKQPLTNWKYKLVNFFSHIVPSWKGYQILIVQK